MDREDLLRRLEVTRAVENLCSLLKKEEQQECIRFYEDFMEEQEERRKESEN